MQEGDLCATCRQPFGRCLCTITSLRFSDWEDADQQKPSDPAVYADMLLEAMLAAATHGIEARAAGTQLQRGSITQLLVRLLALTSDLASQAITTEAAELAFGQWLTDMSLTAGTTFDLSRFAE